MVRLNVLKIQPFHLKRVVCQAPYSSKSDFDVITRFRGRLFHSDVFLDISKAFPDERAT